MHIKELAKGVLAQLGMLDYCIFLWEDQIKRFDRARLSRNLWYRMQGAPDGLSIPPAYLIWLVVGTSDIQAFLDAGSTHAHDVIQYILEKSGLALDRFDAILDFGCGCGRIIRYWKDLQHTQVYGTDYNSVLVQWCRQHLPFAQFGTNHLAPPLSFLDEQFDFVYARSVFTHLAQDLQFAWIEELWRVLKPGGHLLITVSGDQFLGYLTSSEAEQYQGGHLVVCAGKMEGKNYCAVYHPPSYVRQELVGKKFRVVNFFPGDADKPYCMQDTYLLRRR